MAEEKLETRRDAQSVARALIERYGIAAESVARWKALWAREQQDPQGMEIWQWVAGATVELLRAEPE